MCRTRPLGAGVYTAVLRQPILRSDSGDANSCSPATAYRFGAFLLLSDFIACRENQRNLLVRIGRCPYLFAAELAAGAYLEIYRCCDCQHCYWVRCNAGIHLFHAEVFFSACALEIWLAFHCWNHTLPAHSIGTAELAATRLDLCSLCHPQLRTGIFCCTMVDL